MYMPMRLSSVAFLLVLGCSQAQHKTQTSKKLEKEELRLSKIPTSYKSHKRSNRFHPTGLYMDNKLLWLFSEDHPEQWGFNPDHLKDGIVAKRTGPLRTRTCITVPAPAQCLCLGAHSPGGIVPCRPKSTWSAELPHYAGYAALTYKDHRLYVLHTLASQLSILSLEGQLITNYDTLPNTHTISQGLDNITWLASWTPPYIYGLKNDHLIPINHNTPVRALKFDVRRNVLWVVGPNPQPIQRLRGPIEGLYSRLDGYRLVDNTIVHPYSVDLRTADIVDASSLTLWGEQLVIVGTGQRTIALYTPESGHLESRNVGVGPVAALGLGHKLAVINRLDDTLQILESMDLSEHVEPKTLALSPSSQPELAEMGELVFFDKVLWSKKDTFTCNSCHWNGTTDHRLHAGFRQARWEQTRNLSGISMVYPIFTPMQAPSLAHAIQGFFDALDSRWWTQKGAPTGPIRLHFRQRSFTVERNIAQKALLHYLMNRPIERSPWRNPDGSFPEIAQKGAQLFIRDCVRCHEASQNMRHRHSRVPQKELLKILRQQPLVFGAPFYVKTGIKPMFHAHGHRISPLTELYRGGPFFSNGSAPHLEAALLMTNPNSATVHGPSHTMTPFYTPEERASLITFLLSL